MAEADPLVIRATLDRELLGARRAVVRVRFRRGPRARWSTFLLVPDPGESFESVAAKVEPAVLAYLDHDEHGGARG